MSKNINKEGGKKDMSSLLIFCISSFVFLVSFTLSFLLILSFFFFLTTLIFNITFYQGAHFSFIFSHFPESFPFPTSFIAPRAILFIVCFSLLPSFFCSTFLFPFHQASRRSHPCFTRQPCLQHKHFDIEYNV